MYKYTSICSALSILAMSVMLFSCGPKEGANQATAPAPAAEGAKTFDTTPPKVDLLKIMAGRWRSAQDASYEIVIEGNKMKHFNGGNLTEETEIQPDETCTRAACTNTGAKPDGFCFIEKGASGLMCQYIISADSDHLEYSAVGGTGKSLLFNKVKE